VSAENNSKICAKAHVDRPDAVHEKLLLREAEQPFFNASPLSLGSLILIVTQNFTENFFFIT